MAPLVSHFRKNIPPSSPQQQFNCLLALLFAFEAPSSATDGVIHFNKTVHLQCASVKEHLREVSGSSLPLRLWKKPPPPLGTAPKPRAKPRAARRRAELDSSDDE
jgi:hypothetical protein